ncbi:MAG: hypothetical protein J2P21_02330 [Chloracidobacterium sp.]|nr:hypothetical protein [Chloracidobacterium sp.]
MVVTAVASSGRVLIDLFTEIQHTLEFFPRQPKKDRHLFKLREPCVIRRRGAKTFDTGSKINAAHFLWWPVAGGTTTIRILMDTKFAKLHCDTSFRSIQRFYATPAPQNLPLLYKVVSQIDMRSSRARFLQSRERVGHYLYQ